MFRILTFLSRQFYFGLFMALIVAAINEFATLARHVMSFLFPGKENMVPNEIAMKRLKICESCPIYFHPLRTCGSPLMKYGEIKPPQHLMNAGCHCYMPLKSRLKSNGWGYDAGFDFCWPKELNSFD